MVYLALRRRLAYKAIILTTSYHSCYILNIPTLAPSSASSFAPSSQLVDIFAYSGKPSFLFLFRSPKPRLAISIDLGW